MRNKVVNTFKKKFILHKVKGTADTLFTGLLFIGLITVMLLFSFRINMLSEVIYNVDDAMTTSVLGGILPHEEYASTGQYVMQDVEIPISEYNSSEKAIIASELNSVYISETTDINGNKRYKYNESGIKHISDIVITGDTTDAAGEKVEANFKDKVPYWNRKITFSTNDSDSTSKKRSRSLKTPSTGSSDTITTRTLENISTLAASNLANDIEVKYDTTVDNIINSGILDSKLSLDKDTMLSSTYLKHFVKDDINISKVEIYNLYKYTFAKRHIYASPYFKYKVDGVGDSLSYEQIKPYINGSDKTITVSDWRTEEVAPYNGSNENDFKVYIRNLYPAVPILGDKDKFGDPLKPSDCEQYLLLRYLWEVDSAAYKYRGSGNSAYVCFFEDTGITYQGDWYSDTNSYRPKDTGSNVGTFSFLWDNNSSAIVKINDNLITDENGRKILPIEGYTKYTYTRGSDATSEYISFSNKNGIINKGAKIQLEKYTGKNADGSPKYTTVNLYNTSIYIEYDYEVETFPTGGDLFKLDDFGSQAVKSCKLVSVTK